MTKGLKITLIALGVAALGTTGAIIYKRNKDNKAADEAEERRKQAAKEKELQDALSTSDSGYTPPSNSGGGQNNSSSSGYIVPKRNRNNEIVNPLSEVVGRTLYPAQNSKTPSSGYEGADGGAALRTSAKVDDGWWGNKIKDYKGRVAIGTVISSEKSNQTPAMTWYKVKMAVPCCGMVIDYKEGYVRADVVTFDKYEAGKSNASGNMIERYAPMPLGANVFPHSNWMYPTKNNSHYTVSDGNFELGEKLNDLG
jgi:hypothetical protein